MTWQKLVHAIIIASLILVFSEAVLSCSPLIDNSTFNNDHNDAVAALGQLHWPAVALCVGTFVLYLLRRFKGIVILLFAGAALAISPGWSEATATLGPDCEPVGAFGVKVVLGVVAACFVGQLIFYIVERRKSRSHEDAPI